MCICFLLGLGCGIKRIWHHFLDWIQIKTGGGIEFLTRVIRFSLPNLQRNTYPGQQLAAIKKYIEPGLEYLVFNPPNVTVSLNDTFLDAISALKSHAKQTIAQNASKIDGFIQALIEAT